MVAYVKKLLIVFREVAQSGSNWFDSFGFDGKQLDDWQTRSKDTYALNII